MLHLRDSLVPRYAEMIYYGFWFAPEREALQGFMDECSATSPAPCGSSSTRATSRWRAAGRRARSTGTDFVTFEADRVYRQRDAEGFINLNALRLRIRALRDQDR